MKVQQIIGQLVRSGYSNQVATQYSSLAGIQAVEYRKVHPDATEYTFRLNGEKFTLKF